MADLILWGLVFVALVALLVWIRLREGRFLKKRTRDAIRPELLKEFEAEKEDTVRRKSAFQDALKKWGP